MIKLIEGNTKFELINHLKYYLRHKTKIAFICSDPLTIFLLRHIFDNYKDKTEVSFFHEQDLKILLDQYLKEQTHKNLLYLLSHPYLSEYHYLIKEVEEALSFPKVELTQFEKEIKKVISAASSYKLNTKEKSTDDIIFSGFSESVHDHFKTFVLIDDYSGLIELSPDKEYIFCRSLSEQKQISPFWFKMSLQYKVEKIETFSLKTECIPSVLPQSNPKPLPKTFSVRALELLFRDFEKFYEKYIVGISPHKIKENPYVFRLYDLLTQDNNNADVKLVKAFDDYPETHFWQHQFENIKSFIKKRNTKILPERTFLDTVANFKLIGEIDRIEKVGHNEVNIISFRSTKPPTQKDIMNGHSIELPLLSYMTEKNLNCKVKSAQYWVLKGYGEKPIDIFELSDFDGLKQEAFEHVSKKLKEIRYKPIDSLSKD